MNWKIAKKSEFLEFLLDRLFEKIVIRSLVWIRVSFYAFKESFVPKQRISNDHRYGI